MAMTVRFAGLDGEMSGTLVAQHRLIQIGIALSEEEVFSSRIGWQDAEYDPEALAAIGLSPADLTIGPPVEEVDQAGSA
ncbi:MAG TPA: hypothetical protein VMW75_21065, partial [Thermoanaerobaculia bacterium]|nr:hypothetical protein [Thermoanaerobaculia bacterium]